jgi:protein-S-isoprenylcysteine O-methyltransferase Ste14
MKMSRLRKLSWKLLFTYSLVIVMIAFADPSPDKWKRPLFIAGAAFLVASLWIRMWAAGHLVKNKELTITGPYAYVKNPLYIGTFLGMIGFALAATGDPASLWYVHYFNWMAFGFGVLVFIFYYIPYKKKREGDHLHEVFGEAWDHYDRTIPDYFPRLRRYERASNRPWSWAATCENSEQWTPLSMAAGLAVLVWNGWFIDKVQVLIR